MMMIITKLDLYTHHTKDYYEIYLPKLNTDFEKYSFEWVL